MLNVLVENWQPFGAAAGFCFLWLWESWAPFFVQRGRIRHAARNLTVAFINAAVLVFGLVGLTVAVADVASDRGLGLLNLYSLSDPVRITLAFLLLDPWTYWWHRANHRVSLLWRFHRMHHSDDNMDVSTATRFHLGEVVISSGLRLPLIALVGAPIEAILLYELVLVAVTQFHHANIGLTGNLDKQVRYVVVSPNMHKVHHSQERIETDSNYASIFSVWDRLFGTYREKSDYRQIRFGLPSWSGKQFQSLRGMLATPFLADPAANGEALQDN